MNLIVAVDKAWGISCEGKLLYSIPEDMKFFRRTTLGKVVIMGRNTLESFPGGKPLSGRTNIVLSTNREYTVEGASMCHNIEELFESIKDFDPDDVFVIGGKIVYELLLDYCQKAYITKIRDVRRCDTQLINIDELKNWKRSFTSEIHSHEGIEFTFNTYVNKSVLPYRLLHNQ